MARCQWCTAPLPPRGAVCRYCGRRNDVDLRGIHEFTVTRPDSPRTCPACGIPMETLDLQLGGPFYIERCGKCLSLFFDPNEVETVLEKSTAEVYQIDHQRLDEIARERPQGRAAIRYYQCPVCGTAMNRVNFGARSGVIVDQCPAHGMWLESGELRRLLEWKKAGGRILDQKRRVERLEEELRRERRARETLAGGGEPGDPFGLAGGGLFTASSDRGRAVGSFLRTVLRLFA